MVARCSNGAYAFCSYAHLSQKVLFKTGEFGLPINASRSFVTHSLTISFVAFAGIKKLIVKSWPHPPPGFISNVCSMSFQKGGDNSTAASKHLKLCMRAGPPTGSCDNGTWTV